MIKLENTEVLGWEAAIRGMRNPMNSWDKSDSIFYIEVNNGDFEELNEYWGVGLALNGNIVGTDSSSYMDIGPNDHDLMMCLAKAGSVDAKYRRMIVVTVDITAPLYWWKEFDTYKVGTVANSCSTMHKIAAKEFTLEDFSCEHLIKAEELKDKKGGIPCDELIAYGKEPDDDYDYEYFGDPVIYVTPEQVLEITIAGLNYYRTKFLETKDKRCWWQMIQLLPSSYNQRRTVMLNYEVLAGIYPKRKDHKLDEWHDFCDWIKTLPYSEIITLEENVERRNKNG